MKKALLKLGIALLIAAAVCLMISAWAYQLGGSVMDGADEFYARVFKWYHLFRRIGVGLAIPGAALSAAGILIQKDR